MNKGEVRALLARARVRGWQTLDVERSLSQCKTMLVRTGTLRIETDADVDKVADAATSQVEAAGGFVESRQDNGGYLDGDIRRGQNTRLTLRIPVEKYASLLQDFRKSIGGLTSAKDVEETTDRVRDVTGEYVDNAARDSTLEATRAQLQALMSRADLVKDVLQVQRELSSVAIEARDESGQSVAQGSLDTAAHALETRPQGPPPFEQMVPVGRGAFRSCAADAALADGVMPLRLRGAARARPCWCRLAVECP